MSGETEKQPSGLTLDVVVAHWKEIRECDQRALQLQAAEYERRLNSLNHAHEQARQKEADYVTLDKYEDWIKQSTLALSAALLRMNEKVETVDRNLREKIEPLMSRADIQAGSITGRKDFWGYIVGGLGILILIYKVLRP